MPPSPHDQLFYTLVLYCIGEEEGGGGEGGRKGGGERLKLCPKYQYLTLFIPMYANYRLFPPFLAIPGNPGKIRSLDPLGIPAIIRPGDESSPARLAASDLQEQHRG